MSAITKNYIGYEALVSYLRERKNWSYFGFLNLNQDTIVASLVSLADNEGSSLTLNKWQIFDIIWYNHFLDEAKKLSEPNTFNIIKKKIIAKHLQRKRNLQTLWKGIIKEYKRENQKEEKTNQGNEKSNQDKDLEKENLIPTITTVTSFSRETSKDPQEECNQFAVTSLSKETVDQSLMPAAITVPSFPKETEENIIEYPMDLFTVNSKLENDQYKDLEEFEKDIRLIFCNCYTYNDIKSEIYCSGKALESIFNKKWNEKLIFQTRKKGELKRVKDDDIDTDNSITRSQKKQNQILGENKNDVLYDQVVNDALPVTSAYENLVIADESMLQAIVERLLPLKYRIPELSLVMDGKKQKGSGRFGYLDIFILKGTGDNYISLELKYISLVGYVILVIGFRRILWRPVKEVVTNYKYNKVYE
ncbi:bromodomain-containing protein [Rhizophagus clarus]|uniref:Bromodomain-containing protein n=1 Tax=Rhizophagus clarus TaxID=94130 RepID=A0A8H3L9K3_9GLOM|nr:bromodomain-containing protein [Rhizophagus clarus]